MTDRPLGPSPAAENILLDTLHEIMEEPALGESFVPPNSHSGERFPADRLFSSWFRKRGTIYSFVFKKNHRVTNIQTAELVALIRACRRDSKSELAFLSPSDFRHVVTHVAETFFDSYRDWNKAYQSFSEHYSWMMNNIAVIDVLFGSCLVFLPPQVEIDIRKVCALSGYIHSCGTNVYVRNIYKATKEELFARLRKYLKDTLPRNKKALFRPYSHEDFSDGDGSYGRDLRFGLNDIKITVQKSYLRDEKIADIVESMRTEFRDSLVIPYPGNARRDRDLITKRNDLDRGHTLFLVVDHSFDGLGVARGNNHFIICYDQQYINRNPFHIFDENKPAWFDHTTLPHTLAGAMINITRPYWPAKEGPISICDCFVGSGTTLLEASKFIDVECYGRDYEPISPLLLEDNLRFFGADQDELAGYIQELKLITSHLEQQPVTKVERDNWDQSDAGRALKSADRLMQMWQAGKRGQHYPESSQVLIDAARREGQRSYGLLARLVFYTKLKVARRYESALKEQSVDPNKALEKEIGDLIVMLDELKELRALPKTVDVEGSLAEFPDLYSAGVTIRRDYLAGIEKNLISSISVGDTQCWNAEEKYDVIISDPPYGFNTVADTAELAGLYSTFLRKAIAALNINGQLVLALPDWSHTGRRLPNFILKDFVANQVLMLAETLRKEVILPARQTPRSIGVVPYYWESEKALRRAILHFRFRERPDYDV